MLAQLARGQEARSTLEYTESLFVCPVFKLISSAEYRYCADRILAKRKYTMASTSHYNRQINDI